MSSYFGKIVKANSACRPTVSSCHTVSSCPSSCVSSCASSCSSSTTVYNVERGPTVSLAGSNANSYVKVDRCGNIKEIGVAAYQSTILSDALPDAQCQEPITTVLPLPQAAKCCGFDHIAVTWNPNDTGNQNPDDDPTGHWSFGLFVIDQFAKGQISDTCNPVLVGDPSLVPATGILPTGFISNSIDPAAGFGAVFFPSAQVAVTGPTPTIMTIGIWQTAITAFQPVATQAFFQTLVGEDPFVSPAWAEPTTVPSGICDYPTQYKISHKVNPCDAAQNTFNISLLFP